MGKRTISMANLHRLTATSLRAMQGPTPVTCNDRIVAVLHPAPGERRASLVAALKQLDERMGPLTGEERARLRLLLGARADQIDLS
jgi:hypothetical protein